jgi:hypothetical protein
VVDFELHRLRAVYGRLVVREEDELLPLEHLALSIEGVQPAVTWRSGLDGEFYLEDVPAGSHRMIAVNGDRSFSCPLLVPAGEEVLVNLREVLCEVLR